ncbi:MAG: class I SAM-dependent methyltransferase [Alphaproteobacteria bacterium]|nr:MAG: class I SAM-dependent methyltransferase [Alphaproteobacteria bacterium]
MSSLPIRIGQPDSDAVAEDIRREALGELRRFNFDLTLDHIAKLTPATGKRLLDVGCAHGWFLEAAAKRGHACFGVEPDADVVEPEARRVATIWNGFFPDAVPQGETFDIISWNDSLEHLPNPRMAVQESFARLRSGGLLVVKVPSADGLFFRAAALASVLGVHGPRDRMWQKPFPSPHISYFNRSQLTRMTASAGFVPAASHELQAVSPKALWNRICYDKSISKPAAIASWAASMMLVPLLRIFPSDAMLEIFKKP